MRLTRWLGVTTLIALTGCSAPLQSYEVPMVPKATLVLGNGHRVWVYCDAERGNLVYEIEGFWDRYLSVAKGEC